MVENFQNKKNKQKRSSKTYVLCYNSEEHIVNILMYILQPVCSHMYIPMYI